MMLMVFNKNPKLNSEYLIKHTNKSFVFKSLLELAQLVSTATGNGVYKPIKQGAELVNWIKRYPDWTYQYFETLFDWCKINVNLSEKTTRDFTKILSSIPELGNDLFGTPTSAIFRYSNKYQSVVETKTELPILECMEQYKKYIQWKMEK